MTLARTLALGAALAALAASAQAAGPSLSAALNGQNEKPKAADPDGTGMAEVSLDVAKAEVCYHLQVKNIGPATMAHIHKAAIDANGPVVVALSPPDANGHAAACVTADPALVKDIAANPGGYYVNVHNAEFPAGAVRGQLGK